MNTEITNIRIPEDESSIEIIDQTLLPGQLKYISLKTSEQCFEAIYSLRVRGAPAIGIFAAYAVWLLSKGYDGSSFESFFNAFSLDADYLRSSRPTAVNLAWALSRQEKTVLSCKDMSIPEIISALRTEADAIYNEDVAMCRSISEYGLSLLNEGDGVLTHCNAGPLATSRYGTALGPLFLAKEKGMEFRVYADETRPLLQGARITAFELMHAGIDVTLICDNMASAVMKQGKIQACFVGCDRIAANGDTANKIGTSGVAVLARHYGIPFYVLGPTSTIDMDCACGEEIEIEERPGDEISKMHYSKPLAPEGVKCYNPAFDVTDHELISGIVTEKGICYPPYSLSLKKLFE